MNDQPILFYTNTNADKDLKYLVGCNIEDDICVLKVDNQVIALSSALEINRLRNDSKISKLYSMEQLRKNKTESVSNIISKFIQQIIGNNSLTVPQNFPFKLAFDLKELGHQLKIRESTILEERLKKSNHEITEIKYTLNVVKNCFEYIQSILKQSKVSLNGELYFQDTILTSEYLRNLIENFCYKNNTLAENTIVSCGKQSADPHCQGFGPLYANEFIVIDLFPYNRSSGYYSDITRTFIKGSPSDAQIKMYNTVKQAQDITYKNLQPNAPCSSLMPKVLTFFDSQGYSTNHTADIPYGMFHSLGHGFGLDVHEPPNLSHNHLILYPGSVVTLEPGLYYQEVGGIRIEDDFLIIEKGALKLSSDITYDWIID